MIQIDHYKQFVSSFNEKDRALFRYSIGKAARELLQEHYICETIDMLGDHVIVVVNGDQKHSKVRQELTIREAASKLQKWTNEHLRISVTITIGEWLQEVSPVHAYNETTYLSRYRLLFGHGSIISMQLLDETNKE